MSVATQPTLITGQGHRVRLADINVVKGEGGRLFSNPRLSFARTPLDQLEQSIAELGLMKDLTIRNNQTRMELLAGDRRLQCLRSLVRKNTIVRDIASGENRPASEVYEYVPARVVVCRDDEEALRYTVAENLEHLPVTDWDMLLFVLHLNRSFKGDRAKICKVLGRSPSFVCQMLEVGQLPETELERLRNGTLSKKGALELIDVREECVEDTVGMAIQLVRREAAEAAAEATVEIRELQTTLRDAEAARATGDVLAARLIGPTRKKITAAHHKRNKAEQLLEQPEVNGEAIIMVKAANPELTKPGRAPEPWAPKRIGRRLTEVQKLLERDQADQFFDSSSGKVFSREQVEAICGTLEQVLGQRGEAIFAALMPVKP